VTERAVTERSAGRPSTHFYAATAKSDPKSVPFPTPSAGISVEACILITLAAISISLITSLLASRRTRRRIIEC